MSLFRRISSGLSTALGITKRGSVSASNRGRVIQELSIWQQGGRIGGGLTPRQVSNIIRMADAGYLAPLMDLAHECRQKDAHLQAVLGVGEDSIVGLPWRLVLPEDARAKDKRAAKWVEEQMRQRRLMPRLIANLAGATYFSHDVNEIIWGKDKGKLVPIAFEHLAQRRFGYRPIDGAFILRDDALGMSADGLDFLAEWPNKFIVSRPRVTGDAPQREGLCRLLVWAALFRTWTFADWLKTAELSWKPWRIGSYKKVGTNTEDRDDLEAVLDQLSTNGWAALPDTSSIKIEWPGGSSTKNATHAELINILAQEESKAVLGQTETVQSSSSSGYAQAKVHDAVRKDVRIARASQIASDVTRDLVDPMTDLNFADCIPAQFEFVNDDAVDIEKFSKAVDSLAKRVVIPVSWVRTSVGMPEPKPHEDTIGGEPSPEADTPPPPAGGNAPPDETPPAAADGNADGKPKPQPAS